MFDELAECVEAALARACRRASALDAAIEALAMVRGRACSADGLAVAEVDGRGTLVALTLAEAASRVPPERLSAVIVETVQTAAGAAQLRRHTVLDDLTADLGR